MIVRASDLSSYAYCARAWWLGGVLGTPSSNVRELQRGEAAHQAHGRTVLLSRALIIGALALGVIAVVVLLAALF